MFGPKVIEEFKSKYSGQIQVKQDGPHKYVSVGNLTQSGGLVKEVWQPVIKKYGKKGKCWLILGLAAGTVAKLIPQPFKIIGVEIDPLMLKIGRQYFDLDQVPNLKILNIDAKDYLLKTQDRFDFVLVDLYLGDQCPDFVYTKRFLGQLKKLGLPARNRSMSRDRIDPEGERQDKAGQLVIINHLFYDEEKRHKARGLTNLVSKYFSKVELVRVLTNLVIIAGHV